YADNVYGYIAYLQHSVLYTLSLPDALPISSRTCRGRSRAPARSWWRRGSSACAWVDRAEVGDVGRPSRGGRVEPADIIVDMRTSKIRGALWARRGRHRPHQRYARSA